MTSLPCSMHARRVGTLCAVASVILGLSPAQPTLAQDIDEVRIEEIIVTARFREQSIQDLGASIAAFDQNDINRLGISDLSALTRVVPSLNIQERGPNRNEMNIRGVTNFLTTQDLVPSSRPVGIYLDESPVNTLGGSQVDIRYFDLNRVEVLRGPQGTLFGEGASAGAIRYFTNDPNLSEFDGHVEVEAVDIDEGDTEFGVRAAVSIPIVADKVGLRLAGGRFAQGGYIDVIGGERDINDFEATMFRGVLLARPTDKLSIRLMAQYDDSDLGSLGLYTGKPDDLQTNLPQGNDNIEDESLVANLRIDYDVGPGTLTAISSYFDRERRRNVFDQIYSIVNSLTTLPVLGTPDRTFIQDGIFYEQFSQELRYVSKLDGPFQFTVGAFYRDFEYSTGALETCSDSYQIFGLPADCTEESLRILGTPNPDPIIVNEGEQLSFFAELEYAFTDRLKGIFGARSHNEDVDVAAPATFSYLFLGAPAFPLPAVSEKVEIDTVLPKLALEFSVKDDILLYGSFSAGARNGNINSTATLGTMELFAPGSTEGVEAYADDRAETYELGIKTRLADGKVTLNATAYFTDYEDLQVLVAQPPLGFALITNASKAETKGLELDLYATPTDNLRLFAGASYNKSELASEFVNNVVTGASVPPGTQLPFAPETTFAGGGEYEWELANGRRWYLNATASYTGDYVNGLSTTTGTVMESFSVTGLGTGMRADSWSVDLLVSNLFNEITPVAQNTFDAVIDQNLGPGSIPPGITFNEQFLLQPRTYRLTYRHRF